MCVCVAGEMLSVAEQFLEQQIHPTVVIGAYRRALEDMLEILKDLRYPEDQVPESSSAAPSGL